MQFQKPKMIENEEDLLMCKQHQQKIEFVLLDAQLQRNQRLLCKQCLQQKPSNSQIMDYQQLKQGFDKSQREKIQQYEPIIQPHIQCAESLQKSVSALKSRLILKTDYLLNLTQEWIMGIVNQVNKYSFFEELDKYISKQNSIVDQKVIFSFLKSFNRDVISKFTSCLQQLHDSHQTIPFQDIISYNQNLIEIQENEINGNLQTDLEIQRKNNLEREESCETYEGIFWDYLYDPPRQTKRKFNIIYTKNMEIKYTFEDGCIIRVDQIKDKSKKPDPLKNLEQIQFLQWIGQYSKNNQKTGKWQATWKCEILETVGGLYSEEGKKNGFWKELFKNYQTFCEVYEIGEYVNDEKIGNWKYIFAGKAIGGGIYQNGKKNGNWTELSDNFNNLSQVTNCGEYKLDTKIGRWEIYSRKDRYSYLLLFYIFLFRGEGEYNKDGLKNGKWVELSEDFSQDIFQSNEVIYEGNYINDKKNGLWNELKRKNFKSEFQKIREIYYLDFQKKNKK
ncbi:unnamed protein product [Paramecium sonneborni]|uniref:Uncharacterized protein n=1 Tax=Paramecium sonneborni TaxID=65129 RepID=A0A8S1QWC4_9CILI|nr:unnamed protein product [Paramecium sonneborni]